MTSATPPDPLPLFAVQTVLFPGALLGLKVRSSLRRLQCHQIVINRLKSIDQIRWNGFKTACQQ